MFARSLASTAPSRRAAGLDLCPSPTLADDPPRLHTIQRPFATESELGR
jgi:hypothetical protein